MLKPKLHIFITEKRKHNLKCLSNKNLTVLIEIIYELQILKTDMHLRVNN